MKPIHPGQLTERRLSGYLKVTAVQDATGATKLERKAHRTPIHISKPYWDGQCLLLNVMSPTAGLLEGDRVDIDVAVERNAALILSNPTALRIHKMVTGKAVWNQRIKVAENALLENNPEWLIPQAKSRFEQRSRIDLDPRARLFFIEAIAPGRVAFGEDFAFHSFRNRFELYRDANLSALEQYDLRPERDNHKGWNAAFKRPFYISIHIAAPELEETSSFFQEIHESMTDDLRIGSSKLACGQAWNVKLLTEDPVAAKAALEKIRDSFYQAIGRSAPPLRR